MEELVVNLHMHTYYSDGHATHTELAEAALDAGVDVIIVTDHNVLVAGPEDYYRKNGKRVLLLIAEEIHDQARDPQKNHLLVFGTGRELATQAYDPQVLINAVNQAGGLSFIAHPHDPAAPQVDELDITWEAWDVTGYTGIELWNQFSEFKTRIKSRLQAAYYVFFPHVIAQGPQRETLAKWDELLSHKRKVVAIGGSDAHNLPVSLGPIHRRVFPYEWHFRGINTHILVPRPLDDDVYNDSHMVYDAFRQGHAFIGYDLPHSTRGFRFIAHGREQTAQMGDEISPAGGITFQIRLPLRTECRLLKDGKVFKTWKKSENCTHITTEPGVYRVEVYIEFAGHPRGWIFSNPIYVR
jgi:hypothetical protein